MLAYVSALDAGHIDQRRLGRGVGCSGGVGGLDGGVLTRRTRACTRAADRVESQWKVTWPPPGDAASFCAPMKTGPVILVLVLSAGCGSFLSRPGPSDVGYRKGYLGMLSAEQIQDLRFAWHGAVGGVASIARFRTDQSGIERIRLVPQITIEGT